MIDGDAHWLEPFPVFADYLASVAGPAMVDRYLDTRANRLSWYEQTPAQRLRDRSLRPGFWQFTANTRDYTMASLPSLLFERLDELGIDFAVVYPSVGLSYMAWGDAQDAELRQACCRAYNVMTSELFAAHSSRLAPVACIPTNTPEEALVELEFAVAGLGMKGIAINGHTIRNGSNADPTPWPDFYAMDSPYDHDPVWRRCVELGVAVTAHGTANRWSNHRSPTSYVFNHTGFFMTANYAFCKAVTLGGVPNRFPELRFGFLEGGIAYACSLFGDLREQHKLRSLDALERTLKPTNLDATELRELWSKHAHPRMAGSFEAVLQSINPGLPLYTAEELVAKDDNWDDFAAVPKREDITRFFTENYFFGVEAQDKTMTYAFDGRIGARLNPVLGSDIGHYDVTDCTAVLPECYELVEDGLLSESDFYDLTFRNPIRLHTAMNPAFFDGTIVQSAVVSANSTASITHAARLIGRESDDADSPYSLSVHLRAGSRTPSLTRHSAHAHPTNPSPRHPADARCHERRPLRVRRTRRRRRSPGQIVITEWMYNPVGERVRVRRGDQHRRRRRSTWPSYSFDDDSRTPGTLLARRPGHAGPR